MTIAEMLREEVEGLPTKDQRALLTIARSLRGTVGVTGSRRAKPAKKATRKTLGQARAALLGIRGLWKDRTDLPADSAKASIELGRRLMRRSSNG